MSCEQNTIFYETQREIAEEKKPFDILTPQFDFLYEQGRDLGKYNNQNKYEKQKLETKTRRKKS